MELNQPPINNEGKENDGSQNKKKTNIFQRICKMVKGKGKSKPTVVLSTKDSSSTELGPPRRSGGLPTRNALGLPLSKAEKRALLESVLLPNKSAASSNAPTHHSDLSPLETDAQQIFHSSIGLSQSTTVQQIGSESLEDRFFDFESSHEASTSNTQATIGSNIQSPIPGFSYFPDQQSVVSPTNSIISSSTQGDSQLGNDALKTLTNSEHLINMIGRVNQPISNSRKRAADPSLSQSMVNLPTGNVNFGTVPTNLHRSVTGKTTAVLNTQYSSSIDLSPPRRSGGLPTRNALGLPLSKAEKRALLESVLLPNKSAASSNAPTHNSDLSPLETDTQQIFHSSIDLSQSTTEQQIGTESIEDIFFDFESSYQASTSSTQATIGSNIQSPIPGFSYFPDQQSVVSPTNSIISSSTQGDSQLGTDALKKLTNSEHSINMIGRFNQPISNSRKQTADLSSSQPMVNLPMGNANFDTVVTNLQRPIIGLQTRNVTAILRPMLNDLRKKGSSGNQSLIENSSGQNDNAPTPIEHNRGRSSDNTLADEDEYIELEEDENEGDQNVMPIWVKEKEFANMEAFKKYLAEEKIWSFIGSDDLTSGIKTRYRCNLVKLRGPQCYAAKYTMHGFEPGNSQVLLFNNSLAHTHDDINNITKTKITNELKKKIIELYENGLKPRTIEFQIRGIPEIVQPSKSQISYILKKHRENKYGNVAMTMQDLDKFVEDHMNIPENLDEAFIVTYERCPSNQTENRWFRYFMTTKRLIANSADAENIHTDATYKIIIHGYPVIPIGSSDATRRYHLIGIAISTNETSDDYEFLFRSINVGFRKVIGIEFQAKRLIADGGRSIHVGFERVYGTENTSIIMCWFHVMFNLGKHKLRNETNREEILNDIRLIHLAYSTEVFESGCRLFAEKWKATERDFVDYFNITYVKRLSNWYNGASVGAPSTNNASESFNSNFKRFQTFWERKSLAQFKISVLEAISQRSREYIIDKAPFRSELDIKEKDLIVGQRYAQKKIEFVYMGDNENNQATFYIRSNENTESVPKNELEIFIRGEWTTFEEFKQKAFSFHKVTFEDDERNWMRSICTCPAYGQYYMCKHIIGIGFRREILGQQDLEKDADTLPLEPKKKRGRPKKAPKGLARD